MDKVESIPHVHQWFTTSAMQVGQDRCMTCGMWGQEFDVQREEIRVLENGLLVLGDERNAAVKDAERYRWLRVQNWSCSPLAVVTKPIEAIKLGYDCPSRGRLDALIDDCMRERK
jgi:hypothetical protein